MKHSDRFLFTNQPHDIELSSIKRNRKILNKVAYTFSLKFLNIFVFKNRQKINQQRKLIIILYKKKN